MNFFVASAFPVWPGRCIVLSLSLSTTSRPAPWTGGVEPRLAVSVRPESHRQYHYTTAPATQSLDMSSWYYRPCLLARRDELWGLRLLYDSGLVVGLWHSFYAEITLPTTGAMRTLMLMLRLMRWECREPQLFYLWIGCNQFWFSEWACGCCCSCCFLLLLWFPVGLFVRHLLQNPGGGILLQVSCAEGFLVCLWGSSMRIILEFYCLYRFSFRKLLSTTFS